MSGQFTCRVCGSHAFNYTDNNNYYVCMGCGVMFNDPTKMSTPTIKVKMLSDSAKMPVKANFGDAAWDLYSAEEYTLNPHETKIIKTDIAIELPNDHEAQVRARSGMAAKGILVANGPGTIDSGYRGNIGVILHNTKDEFYKIEKGDRIAQLLIAVKPHYDFELVFDMSSTDRGAGGFGSSGK